MVLDTHVHVLDRGFWPDEWFDWVAAQWAAREPGRTPELVRSKIEDGLIDPEGLRTVADMDAAQVQTAVILPMDWGPDFVDRVPIERVNAHAARMVEAHPGRFIAFAGVDPRRPEAEGLVRDAFKSGRAKGLKLYPPTGFDPFDRKAWPLYELCVEHRAPVLFHTGETLAKLKVRYADPLLLQDVHAAFPQLRTIIGHAGAKLWWEEALSVAAHSINSYLELSVWIWDDTTESEQLDLIRKVDAARGAIGIERIVFGSDHLAGSRVRGPDFLRTVVDWYRGLPEQAASIGVEISEHEVEQILRGNAARLLGL